MKELIETTIQMVKENKETTEIQRFVLELSTQILKFKTFKDYLNYKNISVNDFYSAIENGLVRNIATYNYNITDSEIILCILEEFLNDSTTLEIVEELPNQDKNLLNIFDIYTELYELALIGKTVFSIQK